MNTFDKHCLVFPSTIHKVHTTECVATQQAEKEYSLSQWILKVWHHICCRSKGNLLQYHKNTRVITGAKTVTMHLVTNVKVFAMANNHSAGWLAWYGWPTTDHFKDSHFSRESKTKHCAALQLCGTTIFSIKTNQLPTKSKFWASVKVWKASRGRPQSYRQTWRIYPTDRLKLQQFPSLECWFQRVELIGSSRYVTGHYNSLF